jgi:acetolactate synthase-1/3 small subunit
VKINELAPSEAVERELLMAVVRAPSSGRGPILELTQIFGGQVLNVGSAELMVSLDGAPPKLDDFEELLRPFGIVSIQRTGRVALPKLERTTTAPPATGLRAAG